MRIHMKSISKLGLASNPRSVTHFLFYSAGDLDDNTRMGIISDVSRKTLVFGALIAHFASAIADTTDADTLRLQEEVASARNSLDTLILQPGMKLDDPRVKQKAEALDEKMKALKKGLADAMKAPQTPKVYPKIFAEPKNGEKADPEDAQEAAAVLPSVAQPDALKNTKPSEASGAPETVLSGENIKSEIIYEKKLMPGKKERLLAVPRPKVESAEEPVPPASGTPDAAGLSEIQYPKK